MDHGWKPGSRLGRARFGGGTTTLVLGALAAGLAAAAVVAGLVVWISRPPTGWTWLIVTVTVTSTLPALTVFGWLALVDWGSLPTRGAHPEESVESSWLQRAGCGALGDLLVLAAIGSAVVAFAFPAVNPSLVLGLVPVVGILALGVRYLRLARKER